MSIFQDMLAIKRFRESQAELAVARERQQHARALREREQAELRLVQCRRHAEHTETSLYEELCSRVVRVREIENVLQDVATLRQAVQQHEQQLEHVQADLERAIQSLAQTREHHRTASRMTEKFVELARNHSAEQVKAMEYREDMEMEEAASVARERDDWEHHGTFEPA